MLCFWGRERPIDFDEASHIGPGATLIQKETLTCIDMPASIACVVSGHQARLVDGG